MFPEALDMSFRMASGKFWVTKEGPFKFLTHSQVNITIFTNGDLILL